MPVDPAPGGRATRGGAYAPFIPPRIAERPISLGVDAAAAIADAERALAELRRVAPRLTSVEAVAESLLRTESLASSRIEGVHASHERVAGLSGAARGGGTEDPRAREVLGNVDAVRTAAQIGRRDAGPTIEDLQEIHRSLFGFTGDPAIAGSIRERRHWFGGDNYNPLGADFVPPPPELLHGFLDDLCAFLDRADIHPCAQAAIAHAQFKNIHPFAAGNGRTGRALVYAVLRRHGAIGSLIPPISAVLESEPKAYVGGLGAYGVGQIDAWCAAFAKATARAAREARGFVDAIDAREAEWLERLRNPRIDSAVRQILRELPATPILDARRAETATGKSHTAVHNAFHQLAEREILVPLGDRRWGQVWAAGELLGLVADFERQLAR